MRGDEADVALDSIVRKEPNILDGVSDMAAELDHVPLARWAAVDQQLAARRFQKAVDQLESGGLPRSAAAEEREDFAALDFEIQIAQDGAAIGEMVGNVTEFDDGCGGHAL